MSRATEERSARRAGNAERDAKIKNLHTEIGAAVAALVADPAWRAMLDTAAKFHRYSLSNQLLIAAQAERRGFAPTRVAGFHAWESLGRSVRKGERGLAILAPCSNKPAGDNDSPEAGGGGEQPATPPESTRRVLRGFRVAHVFDLCQTDGDELPDVLPELLTGGAPDRLWDGLTEQIETAGYRVARGDCPSGVNGVTDRLTRTVTVRADVDDAQAVKTLAHELAHIGCGHLAPGYDYGGCRGQAEAEAESVACIVTAWAGLDTAAYTIPYLARWSGGDPAVVHAAAKTVTAVAHAVIDAVNPATDAAQPAPAFAAR